MRFLTVIVAVFAMATFVWPCEFASAQSLWQNRADKWANPVGDLRAHRPGDLLVVNIRENTDVQNREQRLLDKKGQSTATATAGVDFSGVLGGMIGDANANEATSSNRKFDANNQMRMEREFIDKFTVTVIDVLPNGNLLIAGKRQIALEGDNRALVLTGQVRPVDVKADNSIPSSVVAGLDFRYESDDTGTEHAFLNQGWMGRKLNKWLPF